MRCFFNKIELLEAQHVKCLKSVDLCQASHIANQNSSRGCKMYISLWFWRHTVALWLLHKPKKKKKKRNFSNVIYLAAGWIFCRSLVRFNKCLVSVGKVMSSVCFSRPNLFSNPVFPSKTDNSYWIKSNCLQPQSEPVVFFIIVIESACSLMVDQSYLLPCKQI